MTQRAIQIAVIGAVASTALITLTTASARHAVEETPVATPIVVTKAYTERSDRLRRNETLSHLFARHNVEGVELAQLIEAARPYAAADSATSSTLLSPGLCESSASMSRS